MANEKVARILRSRTDLPDEEIDAMSDTDAWRLVYSLKPERNEKAQNQICFTGFSPSVKRGLVAAAQKKNFKVVKSITKHLSFLCTGPNAGPVKLEKAREQGVILLSQDELLRMLDTGEVP